MRTNVAKLKALIKAHGLKYNWLAEQLKLSESTFAVRLAGKVEFRFNEIAKLCELMRLTEEEKRAVGWIP